MALCVNFSNQVDNYHGREWSGVLNVWKDMPKNSQVVLKTDNDANRDLVKTLIFLSHEGFLFVFQ